MTTTQQIKKAIYPFLKSVGKLIGLKRNMQLNKNDKDPLTSIYRLKADTNRGQSIHFDQYRGKYLLIANTASHCGYTAQYSELQALQNKFAGKLNVVAFPANDFGGQEPGTDDEIANFCAINFGVTFPLMMKSDVLGEHKNPIFAWLTEPAQNGWNKQEPNWNFCKYLITPDGKLLGIFESAISPLDQEIVGLII